MIWVCGLGEMPSLVERLRPARLISLLPEDEQPPTPRRVHPSDHLRLFVDDVSSSAASPCAPARAHIDELLEFLRASPAGAPTLFHCLAGVSRSPAAALVALVLDAPGRELEAARLLRRAAPFASPNRLIIELADRALERRGALVAAREAMGDPDISAEFGAFRLPALGER